MEIFNKKGNIEFEIKNGNGKGKEYYDGSKLMFEGEYSNGFRNGKGKEYFKHGKIKFEGYYLNDEKSGKEKNILLMIH